MQDLPFATQGFTIFPDVLTSHEVASVVEELSQLPPREGKAGIRHTLSHPKISALAHEARLLGFVESILGSKGFPFRATLFNKSPNANWLITWHQDTALPLREKHPMAGWGPWSVKEGVIYAHAPSSALSQVVALRLHLDDSTTLNGPLRVLPGTHAMGVLSDEEIHELSNQVARVTCAVSRGGILAMSPLLVHCSSKSHSELPRRVLHIEYSSSAVLGDGAQLAVA